MSVLLRQFFFGLLILTLFMGTQALQAQQNKKKKKKAPPPFKWVNPPKNAIPGVQHKTFKSPSMGIDVGYNIYLPKAYKTEKKKRFSVIYYLHGGRPGSESKSVNHARVVAQFMNNGKVSPMIYVFVNGGAVSHYNFPQKNSMGEDVFVKELIPHIDKTYRTIAKREGRGLEGFSQGGRGTTRIMFRHPHLFGSAAPGDSGYAPEKRISENNGRESPSLQFAEGYNAYDLAREFAGMSKRPKLPIMIYTGGKSFNYEGNLAYMKFLDSLKIPYQKVVTPDADHSSGKIYKANGIEIMKFHDANLLDPQ